MSHYYHLTQSELLRNSLPFYANSYCSNFKQDFCRYPKGIPHHHFILALSGYGRIEISGESIELKKGEIFFYKAHTPALYYPESEDFYTCFVTFGGFGCESLFNLYNIPDYTVFKSSKLSAEIIDFCRFADSGISDELLSPKLYSLIINFCERNKKQIIPQSLEKALEYIKKNFYKDISLNELCNSVGVSRSTLFKQFKEFLNTSPVSYVNNVRINWAKSYLESLPNLSLESIAKDVGFSSTSYFIETFKSITGTTPAKFRKERLG